MTGAALAATLAAVESRLLQSNEEASTPSPLRAAAPSVRLTGADCSGSRMFVFSIGIHLLSAAVVAVFLVAGLAGAHHKLEGAGRAPRAAAGAAGGQNHAGSPGRGP